MPKRKTDKSTKASKKQEKCQQRLAKTGNLKKQQVALKTVPSEQDLQHLMGEITNIISKEIPKTEGNLLNDYDESEFILIDGDSLLITSASDLTLLQGQRLHFFYVVECFLLDLTSKGAKCIIFFFKDAEHVYFENPDLLSLRAALIIHLVNNTDIPVKTEFSNCFDDSWQDFLKKTSPYFLVISDEGLNKPQTEFIHIFIIHALSKRNSIVFTSGQESDAIRIYGYRIQGGPSHHQFFKQHEENIKLCLKKLLKSMEDAPTQELLFLLRCLYLKDLQGEVHQKYLSVWDKKEDIRYSVCIVSCALALEIHDQLESPSAATKHESTLTLQEAADVIRMYCLSVAFLHNLPLSQRAQVKLIRNDWNQETCELIQQHKLGEFLALNHLNSEILLNMDMSSLPDLSDNMLWKNIVYYYEIEKGPEFDLDITSNICRDYHYLWNGISMLLETLDIDIGASFPLRRTSKCFLTKMCSQREKMKMKVPNPSLIPTMCSVVDEFAEDILNDVQFLKRDDPAVTSLKKWKTGYDHQNWSSRRSLSDDSFGTGTTGDIWALQNDLVLQPSECFYRQSLEDKSSTTRDTKLDNSKQASIDVKKSKNNHKKKADIIVEENKKRKREIRKKEESQWKEVVQSIEREMKENFKSGILSLDRVVKTFQDMSVKRSIEMAGLNACFEKWKEHCKDESKTQKDLNLAAEVMRKIHSLITNYQDVLKEADYQQVVKCLRYLGFNNLIAATEHTEIPKNRKEEFMRKLSKYSVDIGSARFQLQYMSQYLIKEERDDPDPRVNHFIPDTWQRNIFDIVDKGESAVIVAPPSAGKSYASYYCMEKILRDDDEGVVVYVAPTQALVNQIRTIVHNQFNKTLPDGLTLCGVFTQRYRYATCNCQILVTMPHCLETLLLSRHHQRWVKRIRYVIFDEVCYHGVDIRAEVWEHLLLLIQCPFLVLCAALNNPEHLVDWLQSVKRYWQKQAKITAQNSDSAEKTGNVRKSAKEQRESYRVKLVVHEEKYNDLERYVCSAKDEDITIHHYHPFAALTVDYIEKNDFPVNLSLSPRETVILFDTMVKVRKKWQGTQKLDPEKYVHFKDKTVITKVDAKCYEEALKEQLKTWIKYDYGQEVDKVFKLLKPQTSLCSENQMKDRFPHFVAKLQQMDKLPALFFIFNIKRVGELAKRVDWFLEEKQREKQISGSAKQESLSPKMSGMAKISENTAQADVVKQSSIFSKVLARRVEHENMMKRLEKISEMPTGCTYANCRAVDMKGLYKLFDQSRLMANHENLQKLALKGIGTHHAHMELNGRQFVELLFKVGFIQVLTATGTLALGVNTPCKSVVFVQNSEYLDALNYRWICGRAGQRGQHLVGNVYFYNFPLSKIEKLEKSNEPQIQGQFLRISLILRLLLLASKAEDKPNARAKFLSLLKNSLLSFEQPNILKTMKLYFLFSFQFLLKEGYVDQEGNTIGFSELVTQLHCYEPSNFVFAYFLSKGLFHRLCLPSQGGSKCSIVEMENLVLILAHLFGRKYMPAITVKSEQKFSKSTVFLDDLPEDFAAALNAYNCNIGENFGQFLLTVPRLADFTEQYQLPISKLDFSNKKQSYSPLASRIMSSDQERTSISPFVCLSGNSDLDLLNAGTANNVILHTVGISAANIPILHSKKYDKLGRRMPLNAYALDFYKHGSLTAMVQDNGLHDGEAYRLLKDFAFTIKAISISLREHCGQGDRNVMKTFEQLSRSYWDKLEKSHE